MADEAEIDSDYDRLARQQDRPALLLEIDDLKKRLAKSQAELEEQVEKNRVLEVTEGCLYYVNRRPCGGTVLFDAHDSFGVCQKCGAEISRDGYEG